MRENRTCGSEGGGAGRPALPTPIPQDIHRLLRDFYQCPCNSESRRTETGITLVRAVLALCVDYWRNRELLPLSSTPA